MRDNEQRERSREKAMLQIQVFAMSPVTHEVCVKARQAWAASEGRRLAQLKDAADNLPPRLHCINEGGAEDDEFLGVHTMSRKLREVDLVVSLDLSDAAADDVLKAVEKMGNSGVVFVSPGREVSSKRSMSSQP